MIKAPEGLTNELRIDFDFFSVVDRPERPLRLIRYESTTNSIFVPIVIDYGKVTNDFDEYRFNGQYFIKINNASR